MRRINHDDGSTTIENDDGLGGFTFPPGTPEAHIALVTPDMLGELHDMEDELINGDPARRNDPPPRGIFNS